MTPTMGYIFNQTYWLAVKPHRNHLLDPRARSGYDWAIGLLLIARVHQDVDATHIIPTLARSWHIGSTSSIQSHHWDTVLSAPWKTFQYPQYRCDLNVYPEESENSPCYDNFVIKPKYRAQYGNLCLPDTYQEKEGWINPVCRQINKKDYTSQWPMKKHHDVVCLVNDGFPCPYDGSSTAELWKQRVGFDHPYLPVHYYEDKFTARGIKKPR